MGINNDISPKKKGIEKIDSTSEQIQTDKEPESDITKPEGDKVEIPIDRSGSHQPVYEDIFHDHKDPFGHLKENDLVNNSAEDHRERDFQSFFAKDKTTSDQHVRKKHWFLYLIIIGIIIFLFLLVYQNYDKIFDKLGIKSSDTTSQDASSSNQGVEIIEGQNYTEDDITDDNATTDDIIDDTAVTDNNTSNSSDSSDDVISVPDSIDKASISLRVLNGNGISGSAAAVKDKLVAAGYTIGKVTNASKFTYKNTTLYYNTGKEAEAKQVAGELSDRTTELFLNPEVAGEYNVVVVVGKN